MSSTAVMHTNHGDITIELFDEDAPKTVENFKKLAGDNFYNGVIFHRVIKDFMIQGGDPTGTGRGGPGYTFEDEFNDNKIVRGALAMANAGPNTNGSQFFIVTTDAAPWLDGKHTVFGRVADGMEIVDKIEGGETDHADKPVEEVRIEKISFAGKPIGVTRMVTKITNHLSYANVMATLAVFMVLGGGAYAATKLPKNSVTTIQVEDRSLLAKDFKAGQLPAGARGLKGDQGLQGPQGLPGAAGTNGASGSNGSNGKDGVNGKDAATNVTSHRVIQAVNALTAGTATANCSSGERLVTGGGGWVNNITEDLDNLRTVTTLSYNGPAVGAVPSGDAIAPPGWTVAGNNVGGFGERLYAYAICVSP